MPIKLPSLFSRIFSLRAQTAWLTLAISLAMVFMVWYVVKAQSRENAEQQFNLHVREIVSLIEQRLQDHEQILLGGAGLFDASENVQRQEWHDYINRLELKDRFPGILGVGYSQVIQPEGLRQHIEQIRSEGFADYNVKPAGKRSLYTSIIYLEPFSGRNLAAFGYDMFSQATRAEAMTIAAETGETAVSGRVTLVQETHGKVQAGFLMYVPIYRIGLPLNKIEQRWDALQGYVYSPYRVDDLMHGILGGRNPSLDFSVYDGHTVDESEIMYDSTDQYAALNQTKHESLFSVDRNISAYHHTWTIRLNSRPEFESQFDTNLQWVTLFLGMLISGLLFFIIWVLIFRREKALKLAENMTEKIRVNEDNLRQSEERFQLAVRGSNDGIWDWDLLTGEVYYAARYKALLGYDECEFTNKFSSFEQALHPQDHQRVMLALNSHLELARPYDVTFRMKTKYDKWQWFRGRGEAVRNEKGDAVRMVGSISDITEQKLAEAKLEAIAQHSQTILDNIIDGIVTIDTSGKMISFNHAAEVIFACRAEQVLGKKIDILLPDSMHIQEQLTSIESLSEQELDAVRSNGEEFTMALSLTKIRSDNRDLIICVVRDITERRRIDKLKSEFVSTVSHELRTPLTSINGAVGLLASGAIGDLSEQANTLVQTAYKNSKQLSLLIDDLLDMEKIAAGQMQFVLCEQDVMAQVENAIEASMHYGEQYQVTIKLNRQTPGLIVQIDEQRFQQVMSNLMSNAIKFSPIGSSVEINVDILEDLLRISVSDHGPGVPLDFQERIFQKFSQADASDTRQKGGTGLGLSITRELVKHMNGHIDFYSREGLGATFFFELPFSRPYLQAGSSD